MQGHWRMKHPQHPWERDQERRRMDRGGCEKGMAMRVGLRSLQRPENMFLPSLHLPFWPIF